MYVFFGGVSAVDGWRRKNMFLVWRAAWNVPLSIVDRSNSFVGTGTCGHTRSKLFVFVECWVLVSF